MEVNSPVSMEASAGTTYHNWVGEVPEKCEYQSYKRSSTRWLKKQTLLSLLFGEMIQFDKHIVSACLKPPTRIDEWERNFKIA